jgi:hypothetical protein
MKTTNNSKPTVTINRKRYVVVDSHTTEAMRATTPRIADDYESRGIFGIAYVRLPKGQQCKLAYITKRGTMDMIF